MSPCLQGVDLNLPSYRDNDPVTGAAILSRRDMAQYYLSYSGLPLTQRNVHLVCQGLHIRQDSRTAVSAYIHPHLLQEDDTSTARTQQLCGGSVDETLALVAEPVLLKPYLSPLLAPDHLLAQLPPAMVLAAHYDVLRDDALLYVTRLRQAGVQVTSHVIKNGHHASMVMSGALPDSLAALEAYRAVLHFIHQHNSP